MVLVEIEEAYFNITHQTLAIFSRLPIDPAVTHVMKVDDDSFVRAALVHRTLVELSEKEQSLIFMGNMEMDAIPDRAVGSPWYIWCFTLSNYTYVENKLENLIAGT